MALQEQFRKAVVQNRKSTRQREANMLGRVASEVGLDIATVNKHNWHVHVQ
ncbi:MAG: hypothetical protein ACK4QL_00235 [Pseudanabaenaceae cyanobacterium]